MVSVVYRPLLPLARVAVLVLLLANSASGGPATPLNVVGWYDLRPQYVTSLPPDAVNFSALTHLVVKGLPAASVAGDGTINCLPYSSGNITAGLRQLASAHGVKMQWTISDDVARILASESVAARFLDTLNASASRCEFDGIEFDYEPGNKATKADADAYTEFLVAVKAATWPGFVVSADISTWTDIPYVSPSMMGVNATSGLDFVNVMSYFFSEIGSLDEYSGALDKVERWGFEPTRVNLGVPYYDSKQSAWADIAPACPGISPAANTCGGATFVGKAMNTQLGQMVQRRGLAGAFPWQLNYDTAADNNTLFPWLMRGLHGAVPPAPPPTPGPRYLPDAPDPYIYQTREAALAACTTAGHAGLCGKAALLGHPLCKAGWTSDWKGYWMDTASPGCGHAGYNDWPGPAGAYCCNASRRHRLADIN